MPTTRCVALVALWSVVAAMAASAWAAEPGMRRRATKADTRPLIWRQARARDALAAEEVARQDALRKLIGRMYGLRITADVEVVDLIAPHQEARQAVSGRIHGFKEVGRTYYPDGSMQLKMQITLRDVVETVRTVYRSVRVGARLVSDEKLRRISVETRNRTITVIGSGALPGSRGLDIIRAQRAAEVRALEKIAARLFGIKVDANTRVKSFVMASDRVKSVVAASLKGVKFSDIEVGDKIVKVTGRLDIRTTIERIARTCRRFAHQASLNTERLTRVTRRQELKTITEVGKAVIGERAAEPVRGANLEERIVERVLKSDIKIED